MSNYPSGMRMRDFDRHNDEDPDDEQRYADELEYAWQDVFEWFSQLAEVSDDPAGVMHRLGDLFPRIPRPKYWVENPVEPTRYNEPDDTRDDY